MKDPAFSPITQAEVIAYAIIIPSLWLLAHIGIQWERRTREKRECRSNHPASKGLPRK